MPSLPPPSSSGLAEKPKDRTASDDGGFTMHHHSFTIDVGPDGSVSIHDAPLIRGGLMVTPFGIVFGGTFDVTEAVMRWLGEDPYQYQKLQMLDATREERARMRARYNRVVMEQALADLPAYVAAVWNEKSWSAAERRAVMFALWDEAAEDGNALMVEGGARAREAIEAFIAVNLPADGPDGYSADELAAFNRKRTSNAMFIPYRNAPDDPPELENSPARQVVASADAVRLLRSF